MIQLFERAVDSVGLHMEQGNKIWDLYIEYALQQAELLSSSANENSQIAALELVRSLYRRRLAIPLPESDTVIRAYEVWEKEQRLRNSEGTVDQLVPKHVRRSFELAKRGYELRQPFEEALKSAMDKGEASSDLLLSYLAYIKIEEGSQQVSRVVTMYERALASFPVTDFLWLRYGRYVEAHLSSVHDPIKSTGIAEDLYKRALRNCPWVGALWARLIRVIERSVETEVSSQQALESTYSQALDAGLQSPNDATTVVLAYLDTLRRDGNIGKFREVCHSAREWLLSRYENDPNVLAGSRQLTQYWADCELQLELGEEALQNARNVWEEMLKNNAHAKDVEGWLQYAEYERRTSDGHEAASIYKRCFELASPGSDKIAAGQAWLRFEREVGSAQDYFCCWLEVEPLLEAEQLHAWSSEPAIATESDGHRGEAMMAPPAPPKMNDKDVKMKRQQNDPNYKKRMKDDSEMGAEKRNKKQKTEREGRKGKDTSQAPQPQPQRQPHVIFVKHLPDDADEEALKDIFGRCGTIVRIKMGLNKATNKHRGFAYIHYDSLEGVEQACSQLNGSKMGDKVLFVAPSAPPKSVRHPAPRDAKGVAPTGQQRNRPRAMLEVSGASKPPTGMSSVMLPRSATLRPTQSVPSSDKGGPKSNADFRKLLNRE